MLLEADVALAPLTTLKLGGHARFYTRAETEDDVAEALAWATQHGHRSYVLGGGSNVVVPDGKLDGLVIALGLLGRRVEGSGAARQVSVGAGEPWDRFVAWSVEQGLSGLECLSGIPGLVGATPIQNVGAYGQEVSETIERLRAFDRRTRGFVTLTGSECEFGYRGSRFKARDKDRFVITEVTFTLPAAGAPKIKYPELARAAAAVSDKPSLSQLRRVVLDLRRSKSMVLDPDDPNSRSCGSFFMNPVVDSDVAEAASTSLGRPDLPRFPQPDGRVKLPAAFLIEQSGFAKGLRRGNVGISSRHALALVCHDGASAAELVAFAAEVVHGVHERTGVKLEPEPVIW